MSDQLIQKFKHTLISIQESSATHDNDSAYNHMELGAKD